MTEEQIKQNAEEYAHKVTNSNSKKELCKIINDFIAGAHSRDEEIEMLQNQIEELSEQLKMSAENIQKLRNPWISVEERLPDIGQKVITITNKGKMLLVARTTQPPHKEEGGWRWEHYIGKVTHWMPIPKIEEGE